ncbi:MAG: gellan lyase [Paenibacillaceae bacterium]|nr:gellan lyase [Paenibacillaceae bacterium]
MKMRQPLRIWLVRVIILALLSPAYSSLAYAYDTGQSTGEGGASVAASVYESVYKQVELKPSADSYTLNSRADTNYGLSDLLVLKKDNYSNTTRKIYTTYPLSALNIRDPQSVLGAALLLYRTDNTGTAGEVGAYPVDSTAWQEQGITWNNAPAHAADPLTVATVRPESKFYEFDVTEYVKSHWQEEALSFAFLGQVQGQQINFASKDQSAAGAGKEPRLVIKLLQTALVSIEVAAPPAKSVYYPGEELDLAGLRVTGRYGDGLEAALTDYTVSGFDSSVPVERQPITVTVEDKTAVFFVEIRRPSAANPPSWPEGSTLTAAGTSKTKTLLRWSPAWDNAEITGYRLFANGALMTAVDGQTLEVSLTGLTPSTSYNFRIEAGDAEGNWTAGPELEIFTELRPTELPQVTAIEGGEFAVTDWTVAVNADGKGVWETVNGSLALTSYAGAGSQPLRNLVVYRTPFIGDFAWTGKVAVTPRSDWDDLAVVFNYIDEENYCFVSLNKSNDDATHGIFRVVNNALVQLKDFQLGLLKPGTVQELRVDRMGAVIRVYLDGDFIGETEEQLYTNGRVGFGSMNDRVTLSGMKVYGTELIDLLPPTPPGQLAGVAQSATAIRLSWQASSDDAGIKLYSVYRDGQLLGTTNLTAFVDEELTPHTGYSYYVTATDVSNKSSEKSGTVAVATLEQNPYPFPFRHSLIDSALREPLLQYQLSLEWTSHSLRSGAALMYLTSAAMYDPYYTGSDGTMIKERILAHFRNMLVPGSKREPGASGSLDTSATALAIQAFDLASALPAVWDELTAGEKDKITLIMQAHLVAAQWGHDDDNNFATGIDQLGNFNKGWNPNYVEGAIASALSTVRYLGGAEAANAFLLSFDYDRFMGRLQAAGLSSIAWTFSQTGKSALEAAVKNEFTYKGHGLDEPFQWIKERALIMYGKTVKAQVYSGNTLRAYVNNPEGLPNTGMQGMAHEFDTVDANGVRSDLDYASKGWNNSILSLLAAYYYGVPQSAAQADVELIQLRYAVGSTDLIYKAANGYFGHAKGNSLGYRDAYNADANMGYYWLKDLWENVISQPALIPVRDTEAPTVPGSTGGSSSSGLTLAAPAKAAVEAGAARLALDMEVNRGNGTATAKLASADLAGLLKSGDSRVKLSMPALDGVATYVLRLPDFPLKEWPSGFGLILDTPGGSVVLSAPLLRELAGTAGQKADIELSVGLGDPSKLAADVRAALDGRPLIQVGGKVNGSPLAGSQGAKLVVSIPYRPAAAELAGHERLVIWAIQEDGSTRTVSNGRYDPSLGAVTYASSEFGLYGIVFVKKAFGDIGNAEWSRTAVEVLAAKGVIDGTAADTFAPSMAVTRADFVALLVKTLGLTGLAESSFADVSGQDRHYVELALAEKLGIVQGGGGGRFEPEAAITRQDMMVLAARALALDSPAVLAEAPSGVLTAFADGGTVADYARDSTALLVNIGLIQGDGGRLNPLGSLTRAEAAVLLYRIYVSIH